MRAERPFHPFLEQRFLFKFAQSSRRIRRLTGSSTVLSIASGGGICSPRHHALVGAICILKSAPHFHLDFVNQRLEIADLDLHFAGTTQECAKFSRAPANESRVVFPLEMMPPRAGAI